MLKKIIIELSGLTYRNIFKPIFFKINPELVHESIIYLGYNLGKVKFFRNSISKLYKQTYPRLAQDIGGVHFSNPIGLSAGFDYDGKLTQFLPSLNFGFATVGTITNLPYRGNPSPMMGRLPKSKSLMVNKGFKNEGVEKIIGRLHSLKFAIPVGISVGKTNIPEIKTLDAAIEDIIACFMRLEKSKLKNSYYELNISCPNLSVEIDFYHPANLRKLLSSLMKLNIKKPIFVKMPISKSDKETLEMLEVITGSNLTGVIFGNLQKNRKEITLVPSEVARFKMGNFSGKPTEKRSNELIRLAYQKYGQKLIIIGCGGVFSAQDALVKIKCGASLVQLITGLVFQGPQLVAQINRDLDKILYEQKVKNISQLIGMDILPPK